MGIVIYVFHRGCPCALAAACAPMGEPSVLRGTMGPDSSGLLQDSLIRVFVMSSRPDACLQRGEGRQNDHGRRQHRSPSSTHPPGSGLIVGV